MKKLFLKKYRTKIPRYSYKYFMACFIEIIGILVWSVALYEVYIKHTYNPANIFINIGGLFFTIGSFLYAKGVDHT